MIVENNKTRLFSFDEYVLNESKKVSGKRLNEAEVTTDEAGTGKAKNITQYALYNYGVFESSDSLKSYLESLTVGEFTKMDSNAKESTIWFLINSILPESIKCLGNTPQSPKDIIIANDSKIESKNLQVSGSTAINKGEIALGDKNKYVFAVLDTTGKVQTKPNEEPTTNLSAPLSELACSILGDKSLRIRISLGGLLEKLAKSDKPNSIKEEDVSDYIKTGANGIPTLASNIKGNFEKGQINKTLESWAKHFTEKEKDPKFIEENLPSSELLSTCPSIKEAYNVAKKAKTERK